MKKRWILLIVVLAGCVASPAWAGDYTANSATALQNVLTLAQSNGEDDSILIEAGIYNLAASLSYTPAENKTLVIDGGDAELTVLDGGAAMRILTIDAAGLIDDGAAAVTIRNLTFQNGKSNSLSGGGLAATTYAANILVENCLFKDNVSTGQSGGGLYLKSTDGGISVTGARFTTNSGPIIGGGASLESSNGEVRLTNSFFLDNASSNYGGGLFTGTSTGEMIIVNNVFNGNSSGSGGGAWSSTSTGKINHVFNTYTNNLASSDGGGALITLGDDGGDAYLYNNIIWNNTAGDKGYDLYLEDDGDANFIGGIVEVVNNDYSVFEYNVGDNLTRAGNIAEDPLLTPEFHLRDASPCIDVGQNLTPHFPDVDFEEGERSVDGDLNGDAVVDMGADEYNPVMEIPGGLDEFTYLPVENHLLHTDASMANPFSVGNVSAGTLDLSLGFLSFNAPVDIHVAFFWPALDPNNYYLVTPGDAVQPFDGVLVPYLSDVEGAVDQSLFGAIPTEGLPPGTYHIFVIVSPAGDMSTYYLWKTYFVLN